MHFRILIIVLSMTMHLSAGDKINDAISRGMVTKEFTDTLTHDDVPTKWRTTVTDSDSDRYFKKVFLRGGQKILEVMWSKDWFGARAKMFVATVYDGGERVAKIMRI